MLAIMAGLGIGSSSPEILVPPSVGIGFEFDSCPLGQRRGSPCTATQGLAVEATAVSASATVGITAEGTSLNGSDALSSG